MAGGGTPESGATATSGWRRRLQETTAHSMTSAMTIHTTNGTKTSSQRTGSDDDPAGQRASAVEEPNQSVRHLRRESRS